PQSHRIEFEADEFAFAVFAKNQDDPKFDTLSGLGGITVFVLLDILEAIERRTESTSHPSAELRLKAALEFFDKAKIDLARKAPGYLWAVAAVCNPTLEATWGVSINYDWAWPLGASS
ncbi:MAG: hypothetical protein QOF14_4678, partial [Hyphomicrobiales bacterium]|nr:hypothetical protein [Hyphomicrobiales bacterium]